MRNSTDMNTEAKYISLSLNIHTDWIILYKTKNYIMCKLSFSIYKNEFNSILFP